MLTGEEIKLLEAPYFRVLEENECFYKVESNNVKTEWIVLKTEVPNDTKPIVVYRKRFKKGVRFNLVSVEESVEMAVSQIKKYDESVSQEIRNRKKWEEIKKQR